MTAHTLPAKVPTANTQTLWLITATLLRAASSSWSRLSTHSFLEDLGTRASTSASEDQGAEFSGGG
jgi:hypothetical protein